MDNSTVTLRAASHGFAVQLMEGCGGWLARCWGATQLPLWVLGVVLAAAAPTMAQTTTTHAPPTTNTPPSPGPTAHFYAKGMESWTGERVYLSIYYDAQGLPIYLSFNEPPAGDGFDPDAAVWVFVPLAEALPNPVGYAAYAFVSQDDAQLRLQLHLSTELVSGWPVTHPAPKRAEVLVDCPATAPDCHLLTTQLSLRGSYPHTAQIQTPEPLPAPSRNR